MRAQTARLEPVRQTELFEIGGGLHEAEHTLVITGVVTESVGGDEEIGQHSADGRVSTDRRRRLFSSAFGGLERVEEGLDPLLVITEHDEVALDVEFVGMLASTNASTRRATSSSVHSPRSYNTFSASGSSGGNAVASTCSIASSALASNGAGIDEVRALPDVRPHHPASRSCCAIARDSRDHSFSS